MASPVHLGGRCDVIRLFDKCEIVSNAKTNNREIMRFETFNHRQ